MTQPGRKFAQGNADYKYSINGQEKSDELGENLTTALYWEYDSRISKRWNIDPKPNISESPYMTFGGNPIWNSDLLGDTLRGANENSAARLKETMDDIAGGVTNRCEKLASFFKVGSDKVTFEQIDKTAFNKAVSDLGLTLDQSTLLNGFVDAINDKNAHFISIVKPGETVDIAKMKNVDKGNITLFANVVNGKDGASIQFGKQSFANINYQQQAAKGQFHPTNKNFAAPRGMILAHELLGHIMGGSFFNLQWDQKQMSSIKNGVLRVSDYKPAPLLQLTRFSQLSSVQVYNLYFRAMGIKMEDKGEYHNRSSEPNSPPGQAMDPAQRNAIPEYLKQ